MKRFYSFVLVVLVVGLSGTWYWAGKNYQQNVDPFIASVISNSPVKITYGSQETSALTFTTEFNDLKITSPLFMGNELAQFFNEKFKDKGSFFKDISDKSTFEMSIPGKSFAHYNPLTNTIKISSPSKATFTVANLNSKVSFYVPENSRQTLSIGLQNHQILFSPMVLNKDPTLGYIPALIGFLKFIEIDAKDYQIIEEVSGKPFYTLDSSSSVISLSDSGTTKILSIEGKVQNSQVHKIENNPFIDDLTLMLPQLFVDNSGKLELSLDLKFPNNIMNFFNSIPTSLSNIPPFEINLKKLKTTDQNMDNDLSLNFGYDTKNYFAKGQLTSVTYAEKQIVVEKTMKAMDSSKEELEEKTKLDITTLKGYVALLIPDLKAASPLKLTFDLKAGSTFTDGKADIIFDTKNYGIEVSGLATKNDIRGQVSLKNSEAFLNTIGDFASLIATVVSPAQKPMVDGMSAALKPAILSLLTPDSSGKNHTVTVTYDPNTKNIMVGKKNMTEVMGLFTPLLSAPLALSSQVLSPNLGGS